MNLAHPLLCFFCVRDTESEREKDREGFRFMRILEMKRERYREVYILVRRRKVLEGFGVIVSKWEM